MRTTKIAAIAALGLLLCPSVLLAQNGTSGNSQSGLRSRLPFSGPANATNGHTRTSGAMRPTTGVANYNYGAAYSQWARRGYQGGMAMQGMQPYSRGAGASVMMRQSNVDGVGANSFNPANPNRQQGEFAEQSAYDDYGWMDFQEAPAMTQRSGTGNAAGGLPNNDTSNATNAQGYTGAAITGADQVAAPGNAATSNAQATSQQPTEWRFFQTPLMDRMGNQQSPPPSESLSGGVDPVQQTSGVSEAAAGGPIKY